MPLPSEKKSIEDIYVSDRRVLVRADFDVIINDEGTITDDHRIVAALPTIKCALDRGARSVVLMSHMGCPGGVSNKKYSLAPVAARLQHLLGRPVQFLEDCVGSEVEGACLEPEAGTLILLENLRFHREEEGSGIAHCEGCSRRFTCGDACKPIVHKREDIELFRARLDAFGDIYVNDAFSVSHLAHSSIVGIDLPDMVAGLSLKKEVGFLAPIIAAPIRPLVVVIGGANVCDRIEAIDILVEKVDGIIICGLVAYTFLHFGFGMRVGANQIDPVIGKRVQAIIAKAAAKNCEVTLPVDWHGVSESGGQQQTGLVTQAAGFPEGWQGMDCGPQSLEVFGSKISGAKTVIWCGPLGVIENDIFSRGTVELLHFIGVVHDRGDIGIVAGSQLTRFVRQCGAEDKVSFMTGASSAVLEMLQGKTLQGVALLAAKPNPAAWQGTAAGKYQWRDPPCGVPVDADADMMGSELISKYSWSDGRKRISIYIELDGLDDVPDTSFKTLSGSRDVTLTIESVRGRRRTFSVANLYEEITSARVVPKRGRNALSLQLQKKEDSSWPSLVAKKSSSVVKNATEDDD